MTHHEHHETHSPSVFSAMAGFARKFWMELAAATCLALGVFLLWEKMSIKSYIYRALVVSIRWIGEVTFSVVNLVRDVERSDIVGLGLVLVAVLLIWLRIRVLLFQRHAGVSSVDECPQCGGDLHRARRTSLQRLIGGIMRVRYRPFSCDKCSYSHARLGEHD